MEDKGLRKFMWIIIGLGLFVMNLVENYYIKLALAFLIIFIGIVKEEFI